MIYDYTNHPQICALFTDDSAKNTILSMLDLYEGALSNEYYCTESICRFLFQMHVKKEDLLEAVFHDADYCAISGHLQETMDAFPNPDSEEFANVVYEW